MRKKVLYIIAGFGIIFVFTVKAAIFVDIDFLNLEQENPRFIVAYNQIKAVDAWRLLNSISTNFTKVKIGIIDSGIDAGHSEFSPEFKEVDLNGTSDFARKDQDPGGHGTQVSGIIGANNISFPNPDNYFSPQMNGILSGVHNLPYSLKVDFDGGEKSFFNLFKVYGKLFDLAVIRGVDIVNLSKVSTAETPFQCLAYQGANGIYALQLLSYFNTLFVVAAGETFPGSITSEDADCSFPANLGNDLSNVITAGGLASDGKNRFVGSPSGNAVNIAAPASDVYAPKPGNEYDEFFGDTSASAPMVTGVAGLLKAIKPELTPSQIKQILIETADPIQTGEPDKRIGTGCYANPSDPVNTGCRLNAEKAVCHQLVLNCVPPSPLVGGNFPISTAPLPQISPAVAFDGENYLVVWMDARDGQPEHQS
ncbi:MAG: hypothetical protein A3G49_05625 [Candidatus Sungbacteria bacterium RIFCSPLOWO2_12_FULL_41_11]|uniref:Peptidase S8/S53 domain-containing protein n=1 Tax=Candidatus Sungbacteria bacterium RIFCSPLOWO2_12_FULL_41_11 TaxID=1802286 RepID=A0A1G2LSW0_9BACT|nr:MAG: hypothetical protein A3G49_05625 [Candidatus Sungbacteria bacterium RIFCSPLOWO2_12_FULL_41_11]